MSDEVICEGWGGELKEKVLAEVKRRAVQAAEDYYAEAGVMPGDNPDDLGDWDSDSWNEDWVEIRRAFLDEFNVEDSSEIYSELWPVYCAEFHSAEEPEDADQDAGTTTEGGRNFKPLGPGTYRVIGDCHLRLHHGDRLVQWGEYEPGDEDLSIGHRINDFWYEVTWDQGLPYPLDRISS